MGSRLKFISKIFQVVGIFQLQILRNANQKYKDIQQTRRTHVENLLLSHSENDDACEIYPNDKNISHVYFKVVVILRNAYYE